MQGGGRKPAVKIFDIRKAGSVDVETWRKIQEANPESSYAAGHGVAEA